MKTLQSIKKLISDDSSKIFTNDLFGNTRKEVDSLITSFSEFDYQSFLAKEEQKEIEKLFVNLLEELKNYKANETAYYLQIIHHNITQIYSIIISSVSNIESILLQRLNSIDSRISSAKNEYDEQIDEIVGLKQKTSEHEKNAEESLKKIKGFAKTGSEEVNNYITKLTSANDKKIEAKRRDIDRKLKEYQGEIENKLDKIVSSFKNEVSSWDKKFDELEGKKSDFENTLRIATTYYRESRFDEYAEAQKKQADSYRKMSIQLMIAVVLIILGITIYNIVDDNTEWYDYLTRSFLAFTLMVPAIYTSRESARHRKNADKYTQMANELRAFEATLKIDDLETEVKNKIKEEIYKRYFGNILFDHKDLGDTLSGFFKTRKTNGAKQSNVK